METKKETFIFHGLGFPIELIDCPMKKIIGEWIIDIDLDALQLFVFKGLIHKPYPLTGREMRFMRKFMGLTTQEFGKKLGVTHAAVVKWEKGQAEMSHVHDVYVRMLCMNSLRAGGINAIFKEISPEMLAEAKRSTEPLPVKASDLKEAV